MCFKLMPNVRYPKTLPTQTSDMAGGPWYCNCYT